MNCDEVRELLPAYAIDALDDDERAEVEAHLEGCDLHPELAELQAGALRLAYATPERQPPAALRGRILERIGASTEASGGGTRESAAAPVVTPRPLSSARRERPSTAQRGPRTWSGLAGYAAAAVLALVVVGLGAWNLSLRGGDSRIVSHAFASEHGGRFLYLPDEQLAVVTFERLAPLPVDQTYQVWAIHEGQAPQPAGLLAPSDAGAASIAIPVALHEGDQVAVTIEPAGGSAQPTSEPIAATGL